MEPPIQGLNLRSMVLLLAMSFRRMLWGRTRAWGSGRLVLGKDRAGAGEDWEATGGRFCSGGQNTRGLGRRTDLVLKNSTRTGVKALVGGRFLPVESSGKALD